PMNLVSLELTRQLSDTLDKLATDKSVRALVLTGANPEARAFCAGSDVKEFPDYMTPGAVLEKKLVFENKTYDKLDDFPKPTIAAVNGLAYGGGLELAVCCDIVIAADNARLALPEIKLGIFPATGGTYRVPRRIGVGRSKIMMFTGDPVDPKTALDWGLIDRATSPEQVLPVAIELGRKIGAGPESSLRLCKQAIDESLKFDRSTAIEQMLELSDQAFCSDECKEGVRAFLGKKTPQFPRS
ncbi:MAG: enoyl-CoA hydratase/isomerase family protein, partial [Burkholderiales bacterium]|nr:enoyl-CoA hydratase/isomerase family protein [Burkholderiales bacterium]